eukprot:COSAG05_NODE_3255_length_2200_cov_1.564017_2_plen_86_part_00
MHDEKSKVRSDHDLRSEIKCLFYLGHFATLTDILVFHKSANPAVFSAVRYRRIALSTYKKVGKLVPVPSRYSSVYFYLKMGRYSV